MELTHFVIMKTEYYRTLGTLAKFRYDFDFNEDVFWKPSDSNGGAGGLAGKILPVHFVKGGKMAHIRQETGSLDRFFGGRVGCFQQRL